MAEAVTVTPTFGMNDDGDPLPNGDPITLTPIAVAAGNTLRQFDIGGDLDSVEFTVYLPLTDEGKVKDDDLITVRGRDCFARVQVWKWSRTNVGGLAVLCHSATGKAA